MASSEYGYNAEGSVTELDQSTTATMIADYTLGYDAAQELTQSIDHGTTTNFAYDVLGELTTYGTTTQSYSNEGSRNGTTTTSGNEVSFDGTYGYDPEGNETSMWDSSVSWSYTYDDDNHMTSAKEYTTAGLVMEANYSYNALGNLVEEDVSTGSGLTSVVGTKYVIDSWNPAKDGEIGLSGSDVIADLRASDGSLETRYVWGDNVGQLFGRYDTGPRLTTDPAGTYFTMTDQNGSVRDIVDSAGSDVDTITYDAFGKALTGIGSYSGHYTFDGYDYDAAATKFYLNNARVYDPESGRWLSQDPEGFAAGDSNLYRYVNNTPTNAKDPSGLQNRAQVAEERITEAIAKGTVSIDKNATGTPGPDVTDWFVDDILSHLAYAQSELPKRQGAKNESLVNQAKYLAAPKWIDFKSGTGKGANTVVLAGHVLRKNQLGNIEFGVLISAIPTFGTNVTNEPTPATAVQYARKGAYDYSVGTVLTYQNHPWAEDGWESDLGKWKGTPRVDNLAAFSVGYEIVKKMKAAGTFDKKAEEQKADVKKIISDIFANKESLDQAVNNFPDQTFGRKLTGANLFFILASGVPFNTDSLAKNITGKKYEGPSSIDAAKDLKNEYGHYCNNINVNHFDTLAPYTFDEWLVRYRELYSHESPLSSTAVAGRIK